MHLVGFDLKFSWRSDGWRLIRPSVVCLTDQTGDMESNSVLLRLGKSPSVCFDAQRVELSYLYLNTPHPPHPTPHSPNRSVRWRGLPEISRFLIKRYVADWKLACLLGIAFHCAFEPGGGTVRPLCGAPGGGLWFHSYLPTTDLPTGRRTSASLCVPLCGTSGPVCVLDLTEGLWCSSKVNPCHFTFNARAHRNLTLCWGEGSVCAREMSVPTPRCRCTCCLPG